MAQRAAGPDSTLSYWMDSAPLPRFPKLDRGRYESPDFATAADRVEIDVRGGMGNVRIS